MKALVFTDLHLHKWSDFSAPTADGGNTRLQDGLSVFKKIQEIAAHEKVQYVIFNGDLFHRRGLLETVVFNSAYTALLPLASWCERHRVSLVLVPGNHDLAARLHGLSTALLSFSSIPGVQVIMEPWQNGRLGFIPYLEDTKAIKAAFKSMRECSGIFFHGGLSGAATGPLEYQPKEELSPDALPRKPLILCGHYHKRQQLKSNIWYVGSPMQHVRGDAGDTSKGCVVVDYAHAIPKLKWFNFDYPQFLERTYPDVTDIANNFVDVSFDINKVTISDIREAYKKARSIQTTPMVVVNDKTSRSRIKVDASFNYEKLMSRYVTKFNKKLTADKLIALGKELLKYE